MITNSIVRWLVTVSVTVLLQLCCCKIEQVVGGLGGLVSHQVRTEGSCCAGEPSSVDEEDVHETSQDGLAVARIPAQGEHRHGAPHGPCNCSCDSQLSYSDNSRMPEFGWITWAAIPLVSSSVAGAPATQLKAMRPEIRCRGGPSVSLSILHCTLLV